MNHTLCQYRMSLFYVFGGFVAGCLVAYGVGGYWKSSGSGLILLRESDLNPQSEYRFIDPLIGVRGVDAIASTPYSNLNNQIQSFISDQIQQGTITAASVYFRDQQTAGGFTINPDEQYNPASLLKVPLMIVYYKLAETDPSILNVERMYSGIQNANLQEHIISPIQLQPGSTYTIEQLIEHMIKYSDNNAAELLTNYLNQTGQYTVINSLFKDLGITELDLGNDYITIRAYSLFFRVLYNATYLDRSYSERALDLLTQTDFTQGISNRIPNHVEVAEKFGEFTQLNSQGLVLKQELNNCGIIYYPEHPYLLCVMTKGTNFSQLETSIAEISNMIFQYLEKTYGAPQD